MTLSACDTGLGLANAGEGVLGLRRGFAQSGAHNLLMTLWAVHDLVIVAIMVDFYRRAFQTHLAPHALAETQRDWLVKVRKEHSLCEAVRLAGPFIFMTQEKLKIDSQPYHRNTKRS